VGKVLPQLLGYSLDQLGLSPHPQDAVLELFHPLFVLRHARLDIGIPSPSSASINTIATPGGFSRLMKMRVGASAIRPACAKVNWRKKAPTNGGGDEERRI
jgi:hypothetical protein